MSASFTLRLLVGQVKAGKDHEDKRAYSIRLESEGGRYAYVDFVSDVPMLPGTYCDVTFDGKWVAP